MPRSNPLWASFNTGEVSKRLHARTDFEKYKSSVALLENMIPLAEGPAMRRAGFRYVAEVASSSVKSRLKRFQFSTEQAYVVEMADQSIRFFRHQGPIEVTDVQAFITNGTFDSDISGWIDQSAGGSSAISHTSANGGRMVLTSDGTNAVAAAQIVTIGAAYTAVSHVLKFRITGLPSDYLDLRIGTTSGGTEVVNDVRFYVGWHCYAFTPGAETVYIQFRHSRAKAVRLDDVSIIASGAVSIGSPYLEADLYEIEGPQSADVLYLFHEDYQTHKLQRLGHTSWSLTEVDWIDGPWLDLNTTATTMTPSATTGLGITITASAVTGINGGLGFQSTDADRLIRIDNPASGVDWGYAIIQSVTNTTTVVADVIKAFATTNADARWMLGAWSNTTGWPSGGAFYEQRLFTFNNGDQPQTVWASNTGDFENMAPDSENSSGAWDGTVQDDDSLVFTISADDVNTIWWASPGDNTLVLGTAGGEWIPQSQGAVLTPTDAEFRRRTSTPAARVQPIRVDNVVLFVQRAKRKVREFAYALESDGYRALDMTRLAQHVTRGGIVEMDLAEEPDSLVWAVREDGQLLSMTYRREENVVGWARHPIGGNFNGDDPVVESVVVIPGADGAGQVQSSENRDEVWVIVKRTINGSTKRYIEVLERDFEDGDAQEDAYYADSIITYDGSAATTITGLDHLEGETVKVYGDGAVLAEATVSSGSITLDSAKSVVQIGLGYTHKLYTLKAQAGTAAGTPVAKKKRYSGVSFLVLNSLTMKFGPSASSLTEIDFRQVSDDMDEAAPLFTGERFVEFDGDWDRDPRIYIEGDDPAPFVLHAIAPEINVTEMK